VIALVGVFVLLGVGVVGWWRLSKRSPRVDKVAAVEKESDDEYLGPDVHRRPVEVVFPTDKGGWNREERDVALPSDDPRRLEAVLRAWLEGPRDGKTLLPPQTQLLSAFVDQNRRAYINFSEEATRPLLGGSASELETLSSIARTISANFPDIADFQILVNGEPAATLGGHISLLLPLSVSYFTSTP